MRTSRALIFVGLAGTSSAFAQTEVSLSGRWSAGVLRSAWTLTDWGDTCGPSPIGGNEAGGVITIHQRGSELTFEGLGRPFGSDFCWDQQPGVTRVSHAGQLGHWNTTCKSASGDPRRVTISTTLSGTDSSLDLDEFGKYEVAIAGRNCSATVRRSRHFALIEREGSQVMIIASSSAAAEKAPLSCAPPGAAARLEATPSSKLLRPGDKFTFHAKIFDDHGCPVAQKVSWRLAHPTVGIDIDALGVLTLKADAPEGELQIHASVAEQSVSVTVYVVSAERYQELLASPSFNGAGESEVAVTKALAPSIVGTRAPQVDPTARRRRTFFVWAVASLAALMGVGAYLVTRLRRDRMPIRSELNMAPESLDSSAAEFQSAKTVSYICPVCGTQYGPESQFCGKDGASLVPIN